MAWAAMLPSTEERIGSDSNKTSKGISKKLFNSIFMKLANRGFGSKTIKTPKCKNPCLIMKAYFFENSIEF